MQRGLCPNRTLASHGGLVVAAVLVLASLIPGSGPNRMLAARVAASPGPSSSAVPASAMDAARTRFTTLRSAGRYADALVAIRDELSLAEGHSDACALEIDQARGLETVLQRILSLSPEAQTELAQAYRMESAMDEAAARVDRAAVSELCEQQLQVFYRYLGPHNWDAVLRLDWWARFLDRSGDYAAAAQRYHEALDTYRELVGPDHHWVAVKYYELAMVVAAQGRFREAEQLARTSLAIHRRGYGEEHLFIADSMMRLALVYMREGKYAEAEPLMRRALAMRRALNASLGLIEQSMHNLAALLVSQGDDAQGETLFRELLGIRLARLGELHEAVAANLSQLGRILIRKGDLAEAQVMLVRCLDINRRLYQGQDHPEVARALSGLARVYEEKQDYARAEQLLREAVAMCARVNGATHPEVGSMLTGLGRVFLRGGKLGEAARCAREAVEIAQRHEDPAHPQLCSALSLLAQCHLARRQGVEAEMAWAQAADAFDGAREWAGRGFTRSSVLESPYENLAAARLLVGRWDDAWPAAEMARGRALGDLLLASRERILGARDAAREDSLQQLLDDLEGQVQVLGSATRSDREPALVRKFEQTRNRLLSVQAAWSEFQHMLEADHPVSEGQAYSLERVQSTLTDRTAVIGWLCGQVGREEFGTWGYVIRHAGPVRWIRLGTSGGRMGPSPLTSVTHDFRQALATAGSWPLRVDILDPLLHDAATLYTQWFDPLSRYLDGVTQLVVIPSGPLLGIPLEAFLDPAGDYLGERYTISYAPSATLYAWLREQGVARRSAHLHAEPTALLIGDPALSSALQDDLPPLSEAGEEIRRIAEVLPQAEVRVGEEASEANLVRMVRRGELRAFDLIHFATHALINDDAPERSALVLAQTGLADPLAAAMAGDRIYDGSLSVTEIVREWRLAADLVSLGGCQTALGRETPGEGFIGLASGFLQAGALALLASLWRVDDEATALLMVRFYENLTGASDGGAGMSKGEALREAKRWLRTYRDGQGRLPFAHPAYWSAFVLIGEPG